MVFNDFTSQTVYYTNDETFSRFIVQIIQIKGRFVIYKDEWVGKMKIISFIYFPEARPKGTIFFCGPFSIFGQTAKFLVILRKKSVASSLRQVRRMLFTSKFCPGLRNFRVAVVLPRGRTNFCQV